MFISFVIVSKKHNHKFEELMQKEVNLFGSFSQDENGFYYSGISNLFKDFNNPYSNYIIRLLMEGINFCVVDYNTYKSFCQNPITLDW